jgi:hypothetical protein
MLIAALLATPVVMSGLAATFLRGALQLVRVTGWIVPGRRSVRAALVRSRPDEPSRAQAAQQPSIA